MRKTGSVYQRQLVGERDIDVLLPPLCEVRACPRSGDAVRFHVRVQIIEDVVALKPFAMHQGVTDDDETSRFERCEDRAVQLLLLGMGRDVVEGERGDDGVAAGELILEPRMSQLVASRVRRASCRGDFEHVRIDVDQLYAYMWESIEDRRRKGSGSRSEIDDQSSRRNVPVNPVDDRGDHPLVVWNERPDRPVVLFGGYAQVASNAVLDGHQPRIGRVAPVTKFVVADARASGSSLHVPRRVASG